MEADLFEEKLETHSIFSQTTNMKPFAKTVNILQRLTIFRMANIFSNGFECVSVKYLTSNILFTGARW